MGINFRTLFVLAIAFSYLSSCFNSESLLTSSGCR